MLNEIHFIRPLWFLMLLPLSLGLFWLWQVRARSDAWQQVCDAHLLPHLLVQFSGSSKRLVLWLLGIGWLLAVLALAGPSWSKRPQPVFETSQARVLVLDLSRSMDATDLKPSRLAQAKFKLQDILKQSTEGQTALLVFAGDTHIVSPLTSDAQTIIAQVPTLDTSLMPVPGSNALAALQAAAALLKQGGASQGDIILLSDGVKAKALDSYAQQLKAQGYRLSVLGVGTEQGAPIPLRDGSLLKDAQGAIVVPRLESAELQALAQAGGGIYVPYSADQRDIYYLLSPPPQAAFKAAQDKLHNDAWEEQGVWLLLLLVPLAALGFRRGWLLTALPIFFLLPPPDAHAGLWENLWQRADQQGSQALAVQQPQQAAQLFESPDWQGVAQYRAGDYAAAEQSFAQLDSADAHYNRGNALAKQGKLPEALQAYEKSLEKNPENAAAKANKALVEKLLEQQKQQEQQQKDRQQGEDQENKDQPKDGQQSDQEQGKDQPKDGQQSGQQQGKDQPKDGQQSGQQSGKDSKEQQQNGQQNAQQNGQQAGKDQSASKPTPEKQQAEEQQAAAQASEKEQEKPSEEQIRQALKAQQEQGKTPPDKAETPSTPVLSAEERQAQEQSTALEQSLNRVQDDPGGLLRRKFAWEHQKRQLQQQSGLTQPAASGESW